MSLLRRCIAKFLRLVLILVMLMGAVFGVLSIALATLIFRLEE